MAGYVINKTKPNFGFHVGTPGLAKKIMEASDSPRVITLQLDCDELDTVLHALNRT